MEKKYGWNPGMRNWTKGMRLQKVLYRSIDQLIKVLFRGSRGSHSFQLVNSDSSTFSCRLSFLYFMTHSVHSECSWNAWAGESMTITICVLQSLTWKFWCYVSIQWSVHHFRRPLGTLFWTNKMSCLWRICSRSWRLWWLWTSGGTSS